ncbi:hypothetical protein Dimus_002257 [Dionaea muscipula]
MSFPLTQQQSPPPPPMLMSQHTYAVNSNHGSVGPVIAVVAVIAVVGVVAAMVGRLCSGRSIMGYGIQFDVEGWVETKFSSCLDGHALPPSRSTAPTVVGDDIINDATASGTRTPVQSSSTLGR